MSRDNLFPLKLFLFFVLEVILKREQCEALLRGLIAPEPTPPPSPMPSAAPSPKKPAAAAGAYSRPLFSST